MAHEMKSEARTPTHRPEEPPRREDSKDQRVARLLLTIRAQEGNTLFWPWLDELDGKPADKKRANKFLLGCILDYQIPAQRAWDNAARLAEQILGDPEDLWDTIAVIPHGEWMSRRESYSLHRFPASHKRVWKIGRQIVNQYQGDARLIWAEQPPAAVTVRLGALGAGEQISRMIAGAVADTKQIEGVGDVKGDRHVCRVLGRVFHGSPLQPKDASSIARRIQAQNPWVLDRPLYLIGQQVCFASNPNCAECVLSPECVYFGGPRGQQHS